MPQTNERYLKNIDSLNETRQPLVKRRLEELRHLITEASSNLILLPGTSASAIATLKQGFVGRAPARMQASPNLALSTTPGLCGVSIANDMSGLGSGRFVRLRAGVIECRRSCGRLGLLMALAFNATIGAMAGLRSGSRIRDRDRLCKNASKLGAWREGSGAPSERPDQGA